MSSISLTLSFVLLDLLILLIARTVWFYTQFYQL